MSIYTVAEHLSRAEFSEPGRRNITAQSGYDIFALCGAANLCGIDLQTI